MFPFDLFEKFSSEINDLNIAHKNSTIIKVEIAYNFWLCEFNEEGFVLRVLFVRIH